VTARLDAQYVLPLRWADDSGWPELVEYLSWLASRIDVILVDGSDAALFTRHAASLPADVRHVAPGRWPGRNGKVAGVMTGILASPHDRVIVADDDVRYDDRSLEAVVASLERADIVRPQNYFTEPVWHARWDTARSLLNRALGADYPGTLGVRRSRLLQAGGYDGDVLFENLELIRTVRAAGGRELRRDDVFVGRRPPTARHFLGQRVRQAYDDLAQPARLAAELALLPAAAIALRRNPVALAAGILTAVALAERGRRRRGGSRVFLADGAVWAPVWLLERGTCVWMAMLLTLRGGPRYSAGRIARAAHSERALRRRLAAGPPETAPRGEATPHPQHPEKAESR
jgi:hypothetical protein